jgi:general secretion pathway protein D
LPSSTEHASAAANPAGACAPVQGDFVLRFHDASVGDLLEQASRWTCRNFIYTDEVARGRITLLSSSAVTSDEAYAAFLAALAAIDITIYQTGKYYKLARAPDSRKLPIPIYTGSDPTARETEQPITKVIRLRSSDSDQMRSVLANFASPVGSDIQSIPPDTLIITDTGLNLMRMERILAAIDRAGGSDAVRLIPLHHAVAKDVAERLDQVVAAEQGYRSGAGPAVPALPGAAARQGGAEPAAGGTWRVLPEERSNRLIVIADPLLDQDIQRLVDELDVPTNSNTVHVVFLKDTDAQDLATVLSGVVQGRADGASPDVPEPARSPPGMAGAGASRAAAGHPPHPASFAGHVTVTADKLQNALLVQATSHDFELLSGLIEKLDRPRAQVFLDVAILEVDTSKQLDFGVAGHAAIPVHVNGKTGVLPLVSQPGTLSSLDLSSAVGLGGFLTGYSGPTSAALKDLTGLSIASLGLVVRALESSSDVNVVSTPQVLATDNEEAAISVGQNVPVQSAYFGTGSGKTSSGAGASNASSATTSGASSQTASGSGSSAGIQRQDVELRLKIKPQISEGGHVALSVEVQNEEIVSQDPTLGPTTAKRSVKTQIVAMDQGTIVIGGLIQERRIRSTKRVPVLGSLPLLGFLFRDDSTTTQRTNLLVFLTPYIIHDQDDYRRILEKKRREEEEFLSQSRAVADGRALRGGHP